MRTDAICREAPARLASAPARSDISKGQIPVAKRNSPTILNVAFNGLDDNRRRRRGFDGSAAIGRSDAGTDVLGQPDAEPGSRRPSSRSRRSKRCAGHAYPEAAAVDTVVARIRKVPEYVALFEDAFGAGTADRCVTARGSHRCL